MLQTLPVQFGAESSTVLHFGAVFRCYFIASIQFIYPELKQKQSNHKFVCRDFWPAFQFKFQLSFKLVNKTKTNKTWENQSMHRAADCAETLPLSNMSNSVD